MATRSPTRSSSDCSGSLGLVGVRRRLESVHVVRRVEVVVDEDYRSFGVTGEIIARVVENGLDGLEAVERVAMADAPIPYARALEREVQPDSDDIAEAVRSVQE